MRNLERYIAYLAIIILLAVAITCYEQLQTRNQEIRQIETPVVDCSTMLDMEKI